MVKVSEDCGINETTALLRKASKRNNKEAKAAKPQQPSITPTVVVVLAVAAFFASVLVIVAFSSLASSPKPSGAAEHEGQGLANAVVPPEVHVPAGRELETPYDAFTRYGRRRLNTSG